MYYASVINNHTTPCNELVWFWLLFVSLVLMISPEVFAFYVATIIIRMMPLIATDVSIDPISFIICSITPTSTILIISTMITSISTILIISLMIISISTILTISLMVISISIMLTISMVISITSCQIRVVWFAKHRRVFVLVK